MYPSPPPTVMGINKKAPETMWQLSQYNQTLKSATQIVFSWASGSSIRLTKYLNLFEQVIPWNFIQTTPILSLCIFLPCSLGSIENVCVLTKKIINDKKSYRVVNNFFVQLLHAPAFDIVLRVSRKNCNAANIFYHIERHIWDSTHQCKVSNAVRLPNSSTCKTRNRNRLRSLNSKILLK